MIETIAFSVTALFALGSALMVVTAKRLVHAVLWLGVTLASTAVFFVLLDAAFLAGIQLLLYVGGVMTLMAFGVMLVRKERDDDGEIPSSAPGRGIVAAFAIIVLLALAIGGSHVAPLGKAELGDTGLLGKALVGPYLLAFEVLSGLLLAAMIGAIVLGRRRDPGEPGEETP